MRTPSECFFSLVVIELSSPSLLTMRIRSINPSILSWPSLPNTGHNTSSPNKKIMSYRIHINYQFYYLNMAKSVTQIFVLWLVLVVWHCHAEDTAAVPLPPAVARPALPSWVTNLHSFAAGGSYISLSLSFACCHIRVPP